MQLKVFQVDAFTSSLFKGNPAAVVILEKEIPYELMQNIREAIKSDKLKEFVEDFYLKQSNN